jgi:protein-tyrosine phosphatase
MDISSYFYKDKCLFGSYPTNQDILELESFGVKYFVDLTTRFEKIKRYNCNVNYISYPIKDNYIPDNPRDYLRFINYISSIIKNLRKDEKVYIHCKGGHGRSGMVIASLLCCIENITPNESISRATQYHRKRPNLKKKWKESLCPNIKTQRDFIRDLYSLGD